MRMQVHPVHQTWISYAITIGVIVVVMALRMRRMGKMRPLKLETLWVVPALYLVVAALMFVQLAADGLGRHRGCDRPGHRGRGRLAARQDDAHPRRSRDSCAQPEGVAGGDVLPDRADRRADGARGACSARKAASVPAMLTDPLIAFALGMFTLQRLEMYLRAKRLLEEARGRV